ncbi:MAG: DUF2927 domain-containing protein [Pseudomonadota bacterium]
MRAVALLIAGVLAACGGGERTAPYTPAPRPPSPALATAIPAGSTAWSNASLARVFTRLTHDLEWGASRPGLVRYESPVRVEMTGRGSAGYQAFLAGYLTLLRDRAGVDIAPAPQDGNLAIRFVSGSDFNQILPGNSCVLAPGAVAWDDFRDDPDRLGGKRLENDDTLTETTIFVPRNAAPARIRSCLIEEVAQALGPANDLYGLGPTIFNDDGAHRWPTALDLLMIETLYQPELRTGLSRARTEAAVRRALDQLNPTGVATPPIRFDNPPALSAWRKSQKQVFAGTPDALAKARRAQALAARVAPGSAFECHSLRMLGQIETRQTPGQALATLRRAAALCAAVHGPGDIRLALIGLDRAIALYRQGSYTDAAAELARHEASLAAHGHEERLGALYHLRAKAYLAKGQRPEAAEARRLAEAWTAYAFGQDSDLLDRIRN